MSAFDRTALTYVSDTGEVRERLDWVMFRCGPVALFRDLAVLNDTIAWLGLHQYSVAQADCTDCDTEEEVLLAIGAALGFPPSRGSNLDSFEDYCRDIQVPAEGGFAVVLHRFDIVQRLSPEFAWHVLDILAKVSWTRLLFGRRLLCLVRSEDPHINIEDVGGHRPWWNNREWFASQRE